MNIKFIALALLNILLLSCSPISGNKIANNTSGKDTPNPLSERSDSANLQEDPSKLETKKILRLKWKSGTTKLNYNDRGELVSSEYIGASGTPEFTCSNLDFTKTHPELFYKEGDMKFLDHEKFNRWHHDTNAPNFNILSDVYAAMFEACPNMLQYMQAIGGSKLSPESLKALEQSSVEEIKIIYKIGADNQALFKEKIERNVDFQGLTRFEFAIKTRDEARGRLTASEKDKPITVWIFIKNKSGVFGAVFIDASGSFGEDRGVPQNNFEKYAQLNFDLLSYPYRKQLDENGYFIQH